MNIAQILGNALSTQRFPQTGFNGGCPQTGSSGLGGLTGAGFPQNGCPSHSTCGGGRDLNSTNFTPEQSTEALNQLLSGLMANFGGGDPINQFGGEGNDTQIANAGPNTGAINQVGGSGNDVQIANGNSAGGNNIGQYGGWGNDTQVNRGGHGSDSLLQRGMRGSDNQNASGYGGNDSIVQRGGRGHDTQQAFGGSGDDTIFQRGGRGQDSTQAFGGEGNDRFDLGVVRGKNQASLDGGSGYDSATIRAGKNLTVMDNDGKVLYQKGKGGGSTVHVNGIEDLNVVGRGGKQLFSSADQHSKGGKSAQTFA